MAWFVEVQPVPIVPLLKSLFIRYCGHHPEDVKVTGSPIQIVSALPAAVIVHCAEVFKVMLKTIKTPNVIRLNLVAIFIVSY